MAERYLVFGFGSLINSQSRARTLGSVPAWPVRVRGLRRAWNAPSDRIRHTALGLRTEPDATCNGVLCPLPEGRIAALDAREGQYRRTVLPRDRVQALGPEAPDGRIVTYMPRRPAPPRPSHPILRSYLDVTLSGCLEYGRGFALELLDTTWGLRNGHLEDERAAPRYPLHEAHAPRAVLDALLAEWLQGPAR